MMARSRWFRYTKWDLVFLAVRGPLLVTAWLVCAIAWTSTHQSLLPPVFEGVTENRGYIGMLILNDYVGREDNLAFPDLQFGLVSVSAYLGYLLDVLLLAMPIAALVCAGYLPKPQSLPRLYLACTLLGVLWLSISHSADSPGQAGTTSFYCFNATRIVVVGVVLVRMVVDGLLPKGTLSRRLTAAFVVSVGAFISCLILRALAIPIPRGCDPAVQMDVLEKARYFFILWSTRVPVLVLVGIVGLTGIDHTELRPLDSSGD